MKKIESFTVDHTRLKRGVYISRQDRIGKEFVTTFDIRMKEPNREPVLDGPVVHALEHLGATFLRNHPEYGELTVYFGPMGCLTGFYLLLKGQPAAEAVVPVLAELFQYVVAYQGMIPGATAAECGNFSFMDLAGARHEAARFYTEVLRDIRPENLVYPA